MLSLVESLLALTRGDEGMKLELERNDLVAVAREAVESARASANGEVSVEWVAPEGKTSAVCDRERIRQAVSILLDNAVKYTPAGGRVRVEVREARDRTEIIVSDTGAGIPETELPRIFERFYRANRARTSDGAGLGLSIASRWWGLMGVKYGSTARPVKAQHSLSQYPTLTIAFLEIADPLFCAASTSGVWLSAKLQQRCGFAKDQVFCKSL